MSLDNKRIKTTIRLSEEENGHLRALADAESISVSDYVRRRLFEDYTPEVEEDKRTNTADTEDHKRMMRTLIMIFAMLKTICEQSVSPEKLKASDKFAADKIKEFGYD
ncbi:MAG: plasmid mobilization protein [Alphaproteobacteria bacterium]|jgi:predicted DNA-binding protein